MKILLFGATGFIGNNLFNSLVTDFSIRIAGRKPLDNYPDWSYADFTKENNWKELLKDTDLVINCIGIIKGDLKQVQSLAPLQLYKECVKQNIRIIHISAIGAELEQPQTLFLQTKKKTDDYLLTYNKAKVIYPGIVLGSRGKSARFLSEIAQLPIIPMLKTQDLPFVHINQLIGLIRSIVIDFDNFPKQVFAFSEIEPLVVILKKMKGANIRIIPIPRIIYQLVFFAFPNMSIGIFNKATFILSQQNTIRNHKALLPKASDQIIPKSIKPSNEIIKLFALLSISFIWIWSGISSLISWDISLELMYLTGASYSLAKGAIYLGSFVDILLGITVLFKRFRKQSLILQIGFILIYMLILSLFTPIMWLHPFGVLSKNVPLLVLSYYLHRVSKP